MWASILYFLKIKDAEVEKSKFREFVLASKAHTAENYSEVLPSDDPIIVPKTDEFVDLSEVAPEKLLEALKEE